MEATPGAEPSGAPRVSLAFRVAYNGIWSVNVLPAFAQYIGRLHKHQWPRIPVYNAPFTSVYMKYRQEHVHDVFKIPSATCDTVARSVSVALD